MFPLGEEFYFFLFFLSFFCDAFPYYFKLLVQIWYNFDFFLVYFVSFFVSLNFLAHFQFELQVYKILEFGDLKNNIYDIWCMFRLSPGTHMKFRAPCCRTMANNLREKII
jgi:hypothetical protein